jgi:D-alanine-D-alanine ligase
LATTESTEPRRIGVLMGGLSSEREVSLNTGKGVLRALLERGRDAVAIEWSEGRDLTELLRDARVDVVWNALHGTWGEDGCVQGLLECLKLPYTGSGVLASAVAMDKVLSKRLFDAAAIPTPRWRVIGDDEDAARAAAGFEYPLVIKPSREGSTVGVTIVRDPAGVAPALAAARRCHGEPLIEEFIAGREASVAILDDAVLGTVEIRPRRGFYDYAAKYQSGDTEYLVPPSFGPEIDRPCQDAALRAYLALGCKGHARVDARIDEAGRPWVLEVNTLPGMTGTSLLPKISAHRGLDYATLVERILASAALRE